MAERSSPAATATIDAWAGTMAEGSPVRMRVGTDAGGTAGPTRIPGPAIDTTAADIGLPLTPCR